MSQQARKCPTCGQINYGLAEFCARCGSDIRSERTDFLPWAMQDRLPPMAWAAHDDALTTQTTDPDASGSGFVWGGVLLLVVGLVLDLRAPIQIVLTLAALALILWGLWQLRIDHIALAKNGRWLVILGVVALGAISWRVIEPRAPNPAALVTSNGKTSAPKPTEIVVTQGEMLMNRGGPEHRGTTAGPAPISDLYRSWRFDTGGELYSSPAIADNLLVVGSKSGFLYGLDATTGAQKWSRDIGEYIVRSTPAIDGKTIYINDGYAILALSTTDGTTIWQQTVSFTGSTSPTVVDGVVYVASQSGMIYALDGKTGDARWQLPVDGLLFASPTVDNGHVYVGNDQGTVFALRADNGGTLWRSSAGGGIFSPIVSNGDTVFATTNLGTTVALSAEYGTTTWKYDAGGSGGGAVGSSTIVVSSDDGGVSAIAIDTGKILWTVATGANITVGPTIAGGLVLVASGQTLYGYDLKTGSQIFTYATGNTIQIPPIALDGLVYVGGRDGYLDAIAGNQSVDPTETPATS